jgi:hypothetical protein
LSILTDKKGLYEKWWLTPFSISAVIGLPFNAIPLFLANSCSVVEATYSPLCPVSDKTQDFYLKKCAFCCSAQ